MTDLVNPRGHDVNLRSGPQVREYEEIADRVAQDRPGRVLDWGCGFGQMTALMSERGLNVDAFNYVPDLEEDGPRPLERYPEHQAYLSSDPVRLPWDDDTFDAVLSCGVLEHVGQPERSLDELRRVLKPPARCTSSSCPTAAPTSSGSPAGRASTTTAPTPTTASTTCSTRRR